MHHELRAGLWTTRFGTDPRNAQSHLGVDRISVGAGITLEIAALAAVTYTVQYTDDLATGNWLRLTDVAAQPTDGVESIVDPAPPASRFYRLVTPRVP